MTESLRVSIGRGNIYIPLETYEKYLKAIEAVALLPHEKGVLLYPLIGPASGGLLLKIKNLRGDRVVHAQEFFRNNDFAEFAVEKAFDVAWQSETHALLINCRFVN